MDSLRPVASKTWRLYSEVAELVAGPRARMALRATRDRTFRSPYTRVMFDDDKMVIDRVELGEACPIAYTLAHEFGHVYHCHWFPEASSTCGDLVAEAVALLFELEFDARSTGWYYEPLSTWHKSVRVGQRAVWDKQRRALAGRGELDILNGVLHNARSWNVHDLVEGILKHG